MKPEMDEFFDKQPFPGFIEELKKPVHSAKPREFGRRKCEADEINVSGLYLDIAFPDEEGLLDTAYADFRTFLRTYDISGDRFAVHVKQTQTSCFEEYTITLSQNGCDICAADTEGIRRALVRLEDKLIQSEAPYLAPFSETRHPIIKSRITRGFFSPTNRPPKNIDELWDDVDYYPDEYLNRLAHDANNGIWIYTRFADLIPSTVIPEYGKGSAKRIAKLKRVVDKCARYGIKVYVFAVEPLVIPEELREEYADIGGVPTYAGPAFCTHSERGEQYCIEATEWLFKEVPRLGGFIDITLGERVTNCANSDEFSRCPRCGKYSRGEILAHTADLLREGMRRANSKGELISWTYGHRMWDWEDVRDYVRRAPEDVMLMQNFDDYGFAEQLSKTRFAIDYWLSYVGPSALFRETAVCARQHHKHLFAKMQVCCSHELATVPYIPVPALLFRKYAAAHALGVEGILQCWYFGNYPSVMSKAAGELSFTEEFADEEAFLVHLAGIHYGKSKAEQVAAAWKLFSKGYEQYPVNIMFSYYGPMHDGVVWELQLIPKNKSLPRTWLLQDKPNGDRLHEALEHGHTLQEAIELSKAICDDWQRGLAVLPKEAVGEAAVLAEALGILFQSGTNILEFYRLREMLGLGQGEPLPLLYRMRELVEAEMQNSNRMITLCEQDSRIGYHSEAEGFKFFPAKLRHRIGALEQLLATEFAEVETRIRDGKTPLPFYEGEGEQAYPIGTDLQSAPVHVIEENVSGFQVAYDRKQVYLDIRCPVDAEITVCFEGVLLRPACEVMIRNGELYHDRTLGFYRALFDDRFDEEYAHYTVQQTEKGYRITADRQHIGWTDDRKPFKLFVKVDGNSWIKEEDAVYTLGKHYYSPGEFGMFKVQ